MTTVSMCVDDDFTGLGELIRQMEEDGNAYAEAKAEYYSLKAQKVMELRAAGMAVGIISETVKGDPKVNVAMLRMDCAEVAYRASQEAVLARKMQVRMRNEQANREYYS